MKRYRDGNRAPIICNILKAIILIIPLILILRLLYFNSSLYYINDIELPFSLHLNKQDVTMVQGEELRLYVFGINKRVSYSSTNFRVAWVNFNGRVFACQPGKAFIIAKVDGEKLKCRVRVININKKQLLLKQGDKKILEIQGSCSMVRWSSSNSKVATVNIFGRVKANKSGYTVVKAKVRGKVLTCTVFVE